MALPDGMERACEDKSHYMEGADDTYHDKYTYSISIRDLPETWARKSATVQRNCLAMMTSYTQVLRHNPST